MTRKLINISLLLIILIWNSVVFAQPVITSVSGSVVHKETLILDGADFGVKIPAAPLHWDDAEDKQANSPSSLYNNYNQVWSTYVDDYYKIQYRQVGFRDIKNPHLRGTKFIAGGHQERNNGLDHGGRNVALNICSDPDRDGNCDDTSDHWIAIYYLRYDPNWPINRTPDPNFKTFDWEQTYRIYGDDHDYTNYHNGCSGGPDNLRRSPDCHDDWISFYDQALFYPAAYNQNWGVPVYTYDTKATNPAKEWTRVERFYDKATRIYHRYDNVEVIDSGNVEDGKNYVRNWEIGSVTIGGFYRWYSCGRGCYHLNNDAFRYFDDIYIDTTFARVILANNSNYDIATIIEPQIPSAWNDTSITCVINLGKLPVNGTAYLFVFDADNNHNPIGYPVTIGDVTRSVPSRPTGINISE